MRPERIVVVVGIGTDVGKTWVACALITHLRSAGTTVVARKPAQSYSPVEAAAGATDAHLLAAASGDDAHRVTPPHRWYPVPLAPPMAADALGRPGFRVEDLAAELEAGWRGRAELRPAALGIAALAPAAAGPAAFGIVETAGGVRSPIADDGDALALAVAVDATDVVLVADAGLGVISSVRLAVAAMVGVLPPPIVILNRFDPAATHDTHARNAAWLRDRDGLDVVTSVGDLGARLVG